MINPAAWEAFFAQLEILRKPGLVLKLSGMPSDESFYKLKRTDPVFAARVKAITVTSVWEIFIVRLETMSAENVSKLPDMPSDRAFQKKMKSDPDFAARVKAIRSRPELTFHKPSYGEADWEMFLTHLESMSVTTTFKLPGMPSKVPFHRKMRSDPVFAARVKEIRNRPSLRCHKPHRIDEAKWEQFLEKLKTMSVHRICKLPGMPHPETFHYKRQSDPVFAARVVALRGWAVRVSDRYGSRYSNAVWERYLENLKDCSLESVSMQPGMPSRTMFYNKRRLDAAFSDRAAAVLGSRDLYWSAISPTAWQSFVDGLEAGSSINKLCQQHGMPSDSTVYARARSDPEFAAKLACSIRARTKAQIAATFARRKAAQDHKARQSRPIGEIFQKQLSQNELYSLVKAVVPAYLPPITRDDIICDMVLAVLEGRLDIVDLKKGSKDFVKEHWRLFGNLRDISMDTPIWSDNATTVGERVSGNAADYW